MHLPQNNFSWVTNCEELLHKLPCLPVDGKFGFVAEVDLTIPMHLHDVFDDFPLAPVRKTNFEISQYMEKLWKINNREVYKRYDKLFLTHEDKHHYIIHFLHC